MTEWARGTLFVLSAPSGAGKTSLAQSAIERLAAQGVESRFSVSYTTRAARPGEVDGQHYHFLSAEEFERMASAGEFLEHAEVFGRRYGTGRAATEAVLQSGEQLMLDIDWQGARQVRNAGIESVVSIFVLPPSSVELERRLRARGQDSDEVIAGRMAQARSEMSHFEEYDYLIVNDEFERARDELMMLIASRRLTTAIQQARHRALIDDLLAQ